MNKCLERVHGRHFCNPGVFSYAMIPRCRPNQELFFHRHSYSLCLKCVCVRPKECARKEGQILAICVTVKIYITSIQNPLTNNYQLKR